LEPQRGPIGQNILTGGLMARYVVAGVTGRVGSIVADELLSQGAETTAIVRDGKSAEEWRRRGAHAVVGSLDDAAFLSAVLDAAAGFFPAT
jgi:uncharacterized protein YbjT (DUF2867 family)